MEEKKKLTKEEHIEIHKKLHHSLDMLVADYILNHFSDYGLEKTSVLELIKWSHKQTTDPDDLNEVLNDNTKTD